MGVNFKVGDYIEIKTKLLGNKIIKGIVTFIGSGKEADVYDEPTTILLEGFWSDVAKGGTVVFVDGRLFGDPNVSGYADHEITDVIAIKTKEEYPEYFV